LAPLHLERELDPLAALLQPPSQPLKIGTSIDLVLWGRAPHGEARLTGVAGGEEFANTPLAVTLSSRPLRIGDLAGPMARLDPPPVAADQKLEGKTRGSG